MKFTARAAAAFAVLLTAIVLPPAGAAAKSLTVTDPGTGDAWKRFFDEEKEKWVWEQGGFVNFDALTVQLDHTKRLLKLRVTYAELEKADVTISYVTLLKLPDDSMVNWAFGREDGETFTFINEYDGDVIECEGLTGKMHWDTDVITMSLPRRCIDKPAWVKFKGRTGGEDTSGEYPSMYLDPNSTEGRNVMKAPFSDRVRTG